MTRGTWLLWIGYGATLAAAVGGVFEARRRMIAALDTPEEQARWQEWRAETERLSRDGGPETRRMAKAPAPPMLVLLRDHFGAAIGSTVLAVTLFYWFLTFLIQGSLQPTTLGKPNDAGGPK